MILLLVFFLTSSHKLIKLCFFPHISVWGFCFYVCIPCLLLLLLLSCFFLSQLHSSCLTQCTHFISHNSSHLTSHTTHLTQLISLNSSHTTQLSQELLSCGIWWSCFVFSHWTSPKFFHTTHLTTHTTHLTQLLRFWVGQFCNWSWKSSACKCSTARKMMRLLCVCRHRNMNLINSPHPTGNWSWKSCACLCSTGRKMMRLLCLCVHRNMNVIIPPHPTPPPPPPTQLMSKMCGGNFRRKWP